MNYCYRILILSFAGVLASAPLTQRHARDRARTLKYTHQQLFKVVSMGVQTGKCIWGSSFAAGVCVCVHACVCLCVVVCVCVCVCVCLVLYIYIYIYT